MADMLPPSEGSLSTTTTARSSLAARMAAAQQGVGKYHTTTDSCGCPDHQRRNRACKHMLVLRRKGLQMPANMRGDLVKVTSLEDGSVADAVLLGCIACKGTIFRALLIGPDRDLHLQCSACGESHCAHDSECHK